MPKDKKDKKLDTEDISSPANEELSEQKYNLGTPSY